VISHLGVVDVRHRRVEQSAVLANAAAQCPRKVCLRPSANSGTTIWRDVRPVNAAEYRFQLVTSSKGLAAWLSVAGHAVRSSGDIFALRDQRLGGDGAPPPQRHHDTGEQHAL